MSIFALGKDKIQVVPVRSGYSSNNKKTQVNIFANGGPQKKFLLYSRWITKAGGTYLLFIRSFHHISGTAFLTAISLKAEE